VTAFERIPEGYQVATAYMHGDRLDVIACLACDAIIAGDPAVHTAWHEALNLTMQAVAGFGAAVNRLDAVTTRRARGEPDDPPSAEVYEGGHEALVVPCPRCKREPGEECTSRGKPCPPHKGRVETFEATREASR
jgi:hypothetical protein